MLWPFSFTGELMGNYLEMPAVSSLHILGNGTLRAAQEPYGPSRGSFLLQHLPRTLRKVDLVPSRLVDLDDWGQHREDAGWSLAA